MQWLLIHLKTAAQVYSTALIKYPDLTVVPIRLQPRELIKSMTYVISSFSADCLSFYKRLIIEKIFLFYSGSLKRSKEFSYQ